MFGEIGFDGEFNDFKSSYTLPNNLLSDHPNLLAPLQSLIRKQRSAASGLNIVTTKNPISFKDSNTKNLFQKFGSFVDLDDRVAIKSLSTEANWSR